MSAYDDRPLFIDPVPDDAGEAVGEGRVPRWFVVLAVLLIGAAGYYLFSYWSGPKLSSPHNFGPGRTAYVERRAGE